jgi:hypothetical protein
MLVLSLYTKRWYIPNIAGMFPVTKTRGWLIALAYSMSIVVLIDCLPEDGSVGISKHVSDMLPLMPYETWSLTVGS